MNNMMSLVEVIFVKFSCPVLFDANSGHMIKFFVWLGLINFKSKIPEINNDNNV